MSYFADAEIPVCRVLETSYMVKFFRTASEFLSVSQVKHVAGSPLVDFSAEFSSQQTHSLPGALPGSGQG